MHVIPDPRRRAACSQWGATANVRPLAALCLFRVGCGPSGAQLVQCPLVLGAWICPLRRSQNSTLTSSSSLARPGSLALALAPAAAVCCCRSLLLLFRSVFDAAELRAACLPAHYTSRSPVSSKSPPAAPSLVAVLFSSPFLSRSPPLSLSASPSLLPLVRLRLRYPVRQFDVLFPPPRAPTPARSAACAISHPATFHCSSPSPTLDEVLQQPQPVSTSSTLRHPPSTFSSLPKSLHHRHHLHLLSAVRTNHPD